MRFSKKYHKGLGIFLMVMGVLTYYYVFEDYILNGGLIHELSIFINLQKSWFAFFTIQTNLLAGFWLFIVGYELVRSKKKLSKSIVFNTVVTSYITITGVVYWLVLVPIYGIGNKMSNYWQHGVVVLLCWITYLTIVDYHKHSRTRSSVNLVIIAYPLVYMIYAFFVGLHTNDYLYPFLSVDFTGSIYIVILSVVAIAMFFMIVFWSLMRIKRKMAYVRFVTSNS